MGFATDAQKEEIRERVPLEELLRDYNVHLVPAGRQLKALCPFHQEKTPSFYVHPDKQFYRCYGCEESGDVFRFVQQMERVEFREALEMLARRAGVVLEERGADPRQRGRRLRLYDALALAARYYHEVLLRDPRAAEARRYLEKRGIGHDMWERFQLGYSLPERAALVRHAAENEIGVEALEKAGLVHRRGAADGGRGGAIQDYFFGRLMFPITDVQNRVIGFGARTLADAVPKYLNTAKTELFDKSKVLYGLAQSKNGIRRCGEVAIVEGYTDAIMAHQAGLDHFVASLGTAFTEDNARRLGRLARKVLLVFDGDSAGQNATERSLELLVGSELDVRVYTVTDGKDPCDAIVELGSEEFARRVESRALGIFEFKWGRTVGALDDTANVVTRAAAVDEFLRLVARLPNQVGRQLALREYVERLGVDEKEVQQRLRFLASKSTAPRRAVENAPSGAVAAAAEPLERALDPLAELVLECLLAMPERASSMWEQVPPEIFAGRAGTLVREAVEGDVEHGALSGVRLARNLSDPDARGIVLKVLSRLELGAGSGTENDYPIVWENCQRDLRRWKLTTRVSELETLKARARAAGDRERYSDYRSEYSRLLKELKTR